MSHLLRSLMFTLVLILATSPGIAEPDDWGGVDWGRVNVELSEYYDSNILRYSDKFIDLFENGNEPNRFKVSTLTDLVTRASVSWEHQIPGIGKRPGQIRVSFQHWEYLRNEVKDWSRLALRWNQRLNKKDTVQLEVNWTPDFYIRDQRDSDIAGRDSFHGYSFSKLEAISRYSHRWSKKWQGRARVSFSEYDYGALWSEFNSHDLRFDMGASYNFSKNTRWGLTVKHRQSNARGYDEPDETVLTSDDTDPSFEETGLLLSWRHHLPKVKGRSQRLYAELEISQRDYTTEKSIRVAPFHRGRVDDVVRLYGFYRVEIKEDLDLTIYGQWRGRGTSSAFRTSDLGIEKDYDQYETGVRLSYRFGA